MKFAKVVFWVAGVYRILVITPLYFLYDTIGRRQDPPPIIPGSTMDLRAAHWPGTLHSSVIARDPLRLRTMMIPSVLEKCSFAIAQTVLYLQQRLHASDLLLGCIDGLFGVLFLLSFFRTSS